jgi:hypothetical protein
VERFDALFVVNQNLEPAALGRECAQSGLHRALVVTSHRLFAPEVLELRNAARGCELTLSTFNDWLDDGVMARCDERASSKLRAGLGNSVMRWFYAVRFAAESLYLKNAALASALKARFSWDRAYFTDGLGISSRYWGEVGAERLSTDAVTPDAPKAPDALLKARVLARFLLSGTRLERLDTGERTLLFTSVRRLPFRKGAATVPVHISAASKIGAALRERSLVPARILRRIVGENVVMASTIHGYPFFLADDTGPVEVFVDGFHPSNYPRSYLDQYGTCTFVTCDPLSREWFTRFDRAVNPSPAFIDAQPMREPTPGRSVSRILLALNHAGDWTALINRSDTDALVEAFCSVARSLPGIEFIVRPHPTMVHPSHEGAGSRRRLERYVASLGLPNLSVSQASLEEDLDRSDVVVSEYSQVLIDAFRAGRLGLIVNVTGRRSFMADYEACGFAHVETEQGLADWIRAIAGNAAVAVDSQIRAVRRYNAAYEALMRSAEAAA